MMLLTVIKRIFQFVFCFDSFSLKRPSYLKILNSCLPPLSFDLAKKKRHTNHQTFCLSHIFN